VARLLVKVLVSQLVQEFLSLVIVLVSALGRCLISSSHSPYIGGDFQEKEARENVQDQGTHQCALQVEECAEVTGNEAEETGDDREPPS